MAEMSMVEKVARTIHAKRRAPDDNKHWFHEDPELCDLSRQLARAAIEAMKEPTLEMLESGNLAARSVRTMGVSGQTIEAQIRVKTQREAAAWRAMIDAALNEEVAG